MNLQEMMDMYYEEGLTRELAAARVCQDVVLKAIATGPFNKNVTIKGGVVMRSITKNNRRATRDIVISIDGDITELKHQDYHGKSIEVAISDKYDTTIRSKIDIGVDGGQGAFE